jgi:hypothetical protein
VFLWVTFVLKAVVAGLNDGNTLFELQEKVDSLPKELNPLFRTLLNSIHETDKKFAYAALHVAIHLAGRHRPVDVLDIPSDMSVFRYSFLDDLWRDLDYVAIHEAHNFSPEQLKDRLDRTRRRVRGLCKGLLDITTRRHSWNNSIPATEVVRLTHRSVVDFLEQDELKDEMAKYRGDVDWFDLYCHFILYLIRRLDLKNLVFCNSGIVVFSLCIAIRGQRKALCTSGMLEHSFLGCKSGSRAWYTYRELVPALKTKIYTGMVGGKASDRTNHTKTPKQ